jgi:hypothetical protein
MIQSQRLFWVHLIIVLFINVYGYSQVLIHSRIDTKANTPIDSNSRATISGRARGGR